MINEEKVRELFNIALCDSKSDDSRVQKQSASYYGWDYIWKEGLKSFFTGTFAFAGLVVMWVASVSISSCLATSALARAFSLAASYWALASSYWVW